MFLGCLILLLGVLTLCSVLIPSFQFNLALIFPIFIVLMSLHYIIKQRQIRMVSALTLFFGLWLAGLELNWISGRYEDLFWPIIIIIIGLSLILNHFFFYQNGKALYPITKKDRQGFLHFTGIFSGIEESVKEKEINGITIVSIFGGVDLDLTEMGTEKEALVIEVTSIFGGTDLKMPKDYNVVLSTNSVFGGDQNKRQEPFKEGKKTIYIHSTSILGGTDIE